VALPQLARRQPTPFGHISPLSFRLPNTQKLHLLKGQHLLDALLKIPFPAFPSRLFFTPWLLLSTTGTFHMQQLYSGQSTTRSTVREIDQRTIYERYPQTQNTTFSPRHLGIPVERQQPPLDRFTMYEYGRNETTLYSLDPNKSSGSRVTDSKTMASQIHKLAKADSQKSESNPSERIDSIFFYVNLLLCQPCFGPGQGHLARPRRTLPKTPRNCQRRAGELSR
jgi:hypothetical protein